jgi:single-strand DNA-binding protein
MEMTADPASDNVVFLRGRLAADAVVRELPSGDQLCSFRLTVARPPGARTRVDSLECATTRARVRQTVIRASPGDVCEVHGRLHRRFWRTPAGVASRYEVDVSALRLGPAAARRRSRRGSDA